MRRFVLAPDALDTVPTTSASTSPSDPHRDSDGTVNEMVKAISFPVAQVMQVFVPVGHSPSDPESPVTPRRLHRLTTTAVEPPPAIAWHTMGFGGFRLDPADDGAATAGAAATRLATTNTNPAVAAVRRSCLIPGLQMSGRRAATYGIRGHRRLPSSARAPTPVRELRATAIQPEGRQTEVRQVACDASTPSVLVPTDGATQGQHFWGSEPLSERHWH